MRDILRRVVAGVREPDPPASEHRRIFTAVNEDLKLHFHERTFARMRLLAGDVFALHKRAVRNSARYDGCSVCSLPSPLLLLARVDPCELAMQVGLLGDDAAGVDPPHSRTQCLAGPSLPVFGSLLPLGMRWSEHVRFVVVYACVFRLRR